MGKAIFKLEYLQGCHMIDKPTSAVVMVASNVKYLIKGNNPRYLVNLRVIRKEDFPKFKQRMGNKESVDFSYVADLFISGVIFEDNLSNKVELPIKTENVVATFDYVNDILMCTHISLLSREVLEKVNLEHLNTTQKYFDAIIEKC